MTARVMVVEDDAIARDLLAEVLRADGHAVSVHASAESALDAAQVSCPDVVITDLRMEAMDGIELMRRLHALDSRTQTIVVTAFGSLDTAIGAIQAGAFDYLSKPFAMDEVRQLVRRAVQARHEAGEVTIERREDERQIVGRSAAMTEVFKSIARVAPLRVSVLIQGETGTGKELIARAVHDASDRSEGPYVAINCPSLPEGLLESELFGHVRGAFTGATQDRPGLFETAEGGSILLDEIGDLPLAVQAKLLRTLETREVRRVGSTDVRKVDVRVLAATHRDLRRAVAEGAFREDLLYRLNAVTIRVPPLRERTEDVPALVAHFLQRHAQSAGRPAPRFAPAAMAALERYPWPGNVRELSHVIERMVALAKGPQIEFEDLPSVVRHGTARRAEAIQTGLQTLHDVERAHILAVLQSVGGVRQRAAAILGIDRKTLYRKLLRYGLAEDGDDVGDESAPLPPATT